MVTTTKIKQCFPSNGWSNFSEAQKCDSPILEWYILISVNKYKIPWYTKKVKFKTIEILENQQSQ